MLTFRLMSFVTDLHIHSRFSRACSRQLDLPNIAAWCQLKGIEIVATADFTHPAWFAELHAQLEESEEGLYQLKEKFRKQAANAPSVSSVPRKLV